MSSGQIKQIILISVGWGNWRTVCVTSRCKPEEQHLPQILWVENKSNQTRGCVCGSVCGSSLLHSWSVLTDDQEAQSSPCWPVGKVQPDATKQRSAQRKRKAKYSFVCLSYINTQGEEGKCTEQVKTFATSYHHHPKRDTELFHDQLLFPVICDYRVITVPAAGKNPQLLTWLQWKKHSVHHVCSRYTWLRFVLRAGGKKAKPSWSQDQWGWWLPRSSQIPIIVYLLGPNLLKMLESNPRFPCKRVFLHKYNFNLH